VIDAELVTRKMLLITHDLQRLRPVADKNLAAYLASDEAAVVTGGIFPIDSGYMAFKANVDVMGTISTMRVVAPTEPTEKS